MRYRFLLLLVITLFAVMHIATAVSAAEVKYGDKPNVLFIALDDLNHFVGYFGRNKQGATATPNIDRLAARGVRFTHAYCAAPSCTPSRAALMSGLRPGSTGVYDNGRDWQSVIPADKCLPARFREGGYEVVGSGKIYHGTRLSEWDDYFEEKGDANRPAGKARVPDGVSNGVGGIRFAPLDCEDSDLPDWRIADYGIQQLGKKHDKPFFLAVGLHKPHMPWNVPKKWYDKFPLNQIELPPTTQNDWPTSRPPGSRWPSRRAITRRWWRPAVERSRARLPRCDRIHPT
jgi:arylsulfatase A-like enzyme